MNKNDLSSGQFAFMFSFGVVLVAIGTDLAGRLLVFLKGEWPYLSYGLIILGYVVAIYIAHASLANLVAWYQESTDKKVIQHTSELESLKAAEKEHEYQLKKMRDTLSKHSQRHFELQRKFEKMIEEKNVIPITSAECVEAAVEEAVGDFI